MAPEKQRPGARAADRTPQLVKSLERLIGVVDRMASDLDEVREEQRVQLRRMAQLQAELDAVKHAWEKMQADK